MKKILLFIAILGLFCVPTAKTEATATVGELQEMINRRQEEFLSLHLVFLQEKELHHQHLGFILILVVILS
jgi:hypothetical protein